MKFVIILILVAMPLFAAFEYSGSDVILRGVSASMVATNQNYSAYLLNPATSAAVNQNHLGMLYFQPFGLSDVNYAGLITHFRILRFGTGFTISSFGNEVYRENQLVFNVARTFFEERFFLGMNMRWNNLKIQNYLSMNSLSMDAGIQYVVHPNILMAFSLLNINQPSGKPEEIPLKTNWGMSFRLGEKFDSYIAIQKDSWYPASIRLGFEIRLNPMITLHNGFNTYPAVPSLGLTLNRNIIAIHYAFQYHFDLGGTHFWGLSLRQ
jgi:hypothetical protein